MPISRAVEPLSVSVDVVSDDGGEGAIATTTGNRETWTIVSKGRKDEVREEEQHRRRRLEASYIEQCFLA